MIMTADVALEIHLVHNFHFFTTNTYTVKKDIECNLFIALHHFSVLVVFIRGVFYVSTFSRNLFLSHFFFALFFSRFYGIRPRWDCFLCGIFNFTGVCWLRLDTNRTY